MIYSARPDITLWVKELPISRSTSNVLRTSDNDVLPTTITPVLYKTNYLPVKQPIWISVSLLLPFNLCFLIRRSFITYSRSCCRAKLCAVRARRKMKRGGACSSDRPSNCPCACVSVSGGGGDGVQEPANKGLMKCHESYGRDLSALTDVKVNERVRRHGEAPCQEREWIPGISNGGRISSVVEASHQERVIECGQLVCQSQKILASSF